MNASKTAEIGRAGAADLHKVVLVADRVSKAFPGVLALDDVSFEVRSGDVNALVGENGAGKSTLIKLMAGFYAPDRGEIRIGGQPLRADPAAAHEAGIATIHQEHHLIPSMTVAENLLLGRWPTTFGVLSRASMMRQAESVLDQVAPNLPPRKLARQLSPAESQLVEIARALVDTYHTIYRNEVATDYARRMGADLRHVHLADSGRAAPSDSSRADYRGLIAALAEQGFDGYLTMEIGFDRRSVEPDRVARHALNYIRLIVDSLPKQLGSTRLRPNALK